MRNRLVIPKPWWQVGLAVLPGLMALAECSASVVGLDTGLNSLVLPTMVLLSVSSVLWAAVRRRSFGVAAWGLVPLGLLAAVGLFDLDAIILSWRTPLAPLLLFALGLLLVKHSGLCAGLFVLSGAVLFVDWHIEATMYFWDSPLLGTVVKFAEPAYFFVLSPIWVLRTRSLYGQAAGLLVPIAAYFVTLVFAISVARGFRVAQSASIANPVLIMVAAIAVAVILYTSISSVFAAGEPRAGRPRTTSGS